MLRDSAKSYSIFVVLAGVAAVGFTVFPAPLSTIATPGAGTPRAGTVQFSDVTKKAGIDFVHFKGTKSIPTFLVTSENCTATAAGEVPA